LAQPIRLGLAQEARSAGPVLGFPRGGGIA